MTARRAWIYARASSNKRAQDASPARQIEALRAYVERRGWTVADEGADRISGARSDRPELDRLRAAVREGAVDVVAVQTLSRLGRSLVEVLAFVASLREARVDLVVLKLAGDVVDTTSAVGRFTLAIFAGMDELQRDLYGELAVEGQARARALGKRIGRPAEDLSPAAAAAAARLRGDGLGWPTVARRLADAGHVQAARAFSDGRWRAARAWPPGTLADAFARHQRSNAS